MSKLSIDRMNSVLREGLPSMADTGAFISELGDGTCTLQLPVDDKMQRPGGTLSGPSMMALADAAMWVCVMSQIGEIRLAVTTSFNINFLRRPTLSDVVAEAVVLKLGKRLAVIEVSIFSVGHPREPVAHAVGTYSIPPEKSPQ